MSQHHSRIILLWLWLVSTTTTLAFSAIASQNNPSQSSKQPNKPIPITILSGFLGSGKTTLLQNLLKNKEGFKVAVVVNDVASVNIDSKLVNQKVPGYATAGEDTILELQNGCACCSQSDELLSTIGTLVTLSDLRKKENQFQHIVVELSGVADPKQIRAKFQEAVYMQMTLMQRVQLDTLVTLVDASAFESRFESTAIASRQATPELYYSEGESPEDENDDDNKSKPEMEDWMKELPPQLLQAITGGQGNQDEGSGVADLLVSQTETADIVVLNKCDLVTDDKRIELQQVISALNPRATILQTSYGKIPVNQVLGFAKGQGASMSGDVDDHRDAVYAAQATTIELTEEDLKTSHGHDHSHDHASSSSADTHSHSHDHENCADPTCTDPSHSHSHDHKDDCSDPACTDPSHSHSHDHDAECNDPNCNDPSHTHSHSHDHASTETHAGIGSFVYRARRPFHPARLVAFLQHMPVIRGIPEKDDSTNLEISNEAKQVLKDCLRSKGFVWIANSHCSATYWSHAGTSFELSCLGQWWATLPREMWPDGVDEYVLADFDDPEHDDTSNNVGVGDRRQELVFIGNQYAQAKCQAEITKALNQCLLNDDEYQSYKELLESSKDAESALRSSFSSSLEAKIMAF